MIFALKWQPSYWIFICRVNTNVGIMIPLCILYFKTWVCTPKCLFMTNIGKKYMILGYKNRQSVAMAAILNKKKSPLRSLGTFHHGIIWVSGSLSWIFQLSTFLYKLNPNAPELKGKWLTFTTKDWDLCHCLFELLFIKGSDVLSSDLMKSRSREFVVKIIIAIINKSGSIAPDELVKFRNDRLILNPCRETSKSGSHHFAFWVWWWDPLAWNKNSGIPNVPVTIDLKSPHMAPSSPFHRFLKYTDISMFCRNGQSLHWRHNDHDGISNHQPHGCLLNRVFRRRSKKTSKLRVNGLCAGNSTGRWIPRTKGQLRGKCFHLITSSCIAENKLLVGDHLSEIKVTRMKYGGALKQWNNNFQYNGENFVKMATSMP